jgi:drug/metabolite transporter (DMT)-like permease
MTLRDLGWLVLLAAIWGASYLFMRIAVPVLGALVVADLRLVIAGFVLLLYASVLGRRPQLRGHWWALLALGAVNTVIPFSLIGHATALLNASMASILNSLTPIFTALVAALWMKEALGWRKVLGLVLGIAGVTVLVGWSPLGFSSQVLIGVLGSLGGSLCYGIGGVYSKVRFRDLSALDLAIGQQLAGGFVLLPLAASTAHRLSWSWLVVLAVLALAVLCTALAYLIYFNLMARVGPTNTLSVTFLVPVFGTLWGVLLLNEPLRVSLFAGMAIILTGVLLVTNVQFRTPVTAGVKEVVKQ